MAIGDTPTTICNRALQKIGATLIGSNNFLSEQSRNAAACRACYDDLRRAELRRNVWTFSVKRAVLRAYQTPSNIVGTSGLPSVGGVTELITFGTWSNTATYAINDIVLADDFNTYVSSINSNTGNDPTQTSLVYYWQLYVGPDDATEFVTTWVSTITYQIGQNVIGSDGNSYQSAAANNLNNNPVGDNGSHWVAGQAPASSLSYASYYAGEFVYVGGNLYFSLVNSNTVDPTTNVDSQSGLTYTNAWQTMTATPTLAPLNFVYPIGAGPLNDSKTRNVFRLPFGYLREAPQAPKQGSSLFLGSPGALAYTDWEYDGNYVISSSPGPLIYRYVGNITDTTKFDSLFTEGLACRIALELAQPLTQSTEKTAAVTQEYQKFMTEARMVNGIEQGPTEAPEDDYVTTRR